jgi:Ca2+/H+ antiporter
VSSNPKNDEVPSFFTIQQTSGSEDLLSNNGLFNILGSLYKTTHFVLYKTAQTTHSTLHKTAQTAQFVYAYIIGIDTKTNSSNEIIPASRTTTVFNIYGYILGRVTRLITTLGIYPRNTTTLLSKEPTPSNNTKQTETTKHNTLLAISGNVCPVVLCSCPCNKSMSNYPSVN